VDYSALRGERMMPFHVRKRLARTSCQARYSRGRLKLLVDVAANLLS
jgi:hypothetical protein